MKAKIIINQIEYEIELSTNETILDSCLRAQISPPYSCLEGVCSFCEAEINSGEVKVIAGFETELHPKTVKTCQSFPVSKSLVITYPKKG